MQRALVLLFVALWATAAVAVNVDFIGDNDPNTVLDRWDDPTHWSPSAPVPGDNVYIRNYAGPTVHALLDVPTDQDIAQMFVSGVGTDPMASLDIIGGKLETYNAGWQLAAIGYGANQSGQLNISGGELHTGYTVAGFADGSFGEMNVSGGLWQVHSNLICSPSVGTSSIFNLSGGKVVVQEAWFGGRGDCTATITGGELVCSSFLRAGVYSTATGHVQLDGGYAILTNSPIQFGGVGGAGSMDISGGEMRFAQYHIAPVEAALAAGTLTIYNNHPRANQFIQWGVWDDPMIPSDPTSTTTYLRVYGTLPNVNLAWSPTPAASEEMPGADYASIVLSWNSGDNTAATDGHLVFFGTDADAVANATTTDPEYRAAVTDPCYVLGALALGETYYWRVDEVDATDPGVIYTGEVWSFDLEPFIALDDFESYDANTPLTDTWTSTAATLSLLVDAGLTRDEKSMKLALGANGSASCTPAYGDFTMADAASLSLWLHGEMDNAATANDVYVELSDGVNTARAYYDGDADALVQGDWNNWNAWHIDLAAFGGVNLAAVTTVTVGMDGGDGDALWVDDLRLYAPRCVAAKIDGDIAGTGCNVDNEDLDIVLGDWLAQETTVTAADPGTTDLVLWYPFEQTSGIEVPDVANYDTYNYDGYLNDTDGGTPVWDTTGGYDGNGCLLLDGLAFIELYNVAPSVLWGNFGTEITVSCWIKTDYMPDPSSNAQPHLFHGRRGGGEIQAFRALLPSDDGGVTLELGHDSLQGVDVLTWTGQPSDWTEWTHYAFVKDVTADVLSIYRDGELVAQDQDATVPLGATMDYLSIGGDAWPTGAMHFVGRMDDFRMYNRALTQAEVVYLANQTAVAQPLLTPADVNEDGVVNLADLAPVSADWMSEEILWPRP